MKDVLIIIPTYNEVENIVRIIESIFSLHKDINILVVDDNSPDGTSIKVKEVISKFGSNLNLIPRDSKLGLGTAYISGFKWAIKKKFNFVFSMDADFSHNPSDIKRLYLSCIDKKNDISIGSRYIQGINVVNWPLERIILSYLASWYVRIITCMNIKDPTSGFVCYSVKSLKSLSLDTISSNGYAFQIEMKFKLFLKKFTIEEIPIIFTDREFGKSKLDGSIIGEAFFGVILMKFKSVFTK
jgi:dolichol-phosphate mannosyltransferase